MRKLLLATALSMGALVGTANADDIQFGTFNLEYSEAFGSGNFGYVQITSDGGTGANVYVNVAPSWLIDTGGPHQPFAFNLVAGAPPSGVDNVQLDTLFGAGGANGASPFGNFTNTIVSLDPPLGCSNGGSNQGCGVHDLSFHVTNYYGMFGNTWEGHQVYFAADILLVPCEGACTGNVGGGTVSVPGPIVGAGIPGLVAALGGMFGLNFYRRRRNNSHLPA
jgi:hypothetical protein